MTDATRIVVAQVARVYLAPVGTAAPTSPTAAMGVGWREVGLFAPDTLDFTTAPAFAEVRSHQSNFPTRRFQTTDAATMSVDLQEWSGASFQAVYGGGSITVVTAPAVGPPAVAGVYRFSPPAIGGRTNVEACIEIADGAKHYRRIIPLCFQDQGVQQRFAKSAESILPLRLSVIGSDVGDPWYDISDDPAFASFVA